MSSEIKKKHRHEKPQKSNTLHTVLSFLFSFLLSVTLLLISTVCVVRSTLSEGYTKSCLSSGYYTGLKENVEESAEDYTLPTGIDPSVTENIFDVDSIKNDMESYITGTFKIRQYNIDTSSQEALLRENVIRFLESEGAPTEPVNPEESDIELDEESVSAYNNAVEETNLAVDEYVKEIMSIYQKRIKLPGLDYIVKIGNEYNKYFPFLLVISILLSLLFGFICIKIHRLPHRGLRYMVYAFGGGFLMTFLAPFVVFASRIYNRLNVDPPYFRDFMAAYIKGALAQFMIVSQIWLLVAIVLLVIVAVLRKKSLRS